MHGRRDVVSATGTGAIPAHILNRLPPPNATSDPIDGVSSTEVVVVGTPRGTVNAVYTNPIPKLIHRALHVGLASQKVALPERNAISLVSPPLPKLPLPTELEHPLAIRPHELNPPRYT